MRSSKDLVWEEVNRVASLAKAQISLDRAFIHDVYTYSGKLPASSPDLSMNPNQREWRYEQRGEEYFLRCWFDGREASSNGLVSMTPAWLSAILATARVGGHIKTPVAPPPEVILWFVTDMDNNLEHFIDMWRP